MFGNKRLGCALLMGLWLLDGSLVAQEPLTLAVFAFSERGQGVKGYGENVRDLLYANLMHQSTLILVERDELDRVLGEMELNLSGVIPREQAVQLARMTGARILVCGSVFRLENKLFLVAKVISTETGRVLGRSVSGQERLDVLCSRLGQDLSEALSREVSKLLPDQKDVSSPLESLRKILSGRSLPAVTIAVSEQHVGVRGLDPAAETELIRIWRELGGEVIDPQRGDRARARYHLMGEGISAFGIRQKGVISVKARLEIRVLDGAGQVVAGDTQTSVKLGLSEVIAGKEALADAAGAIAQRLLPQLVNGK